LCPCLCHTSLKLNHQAIAMRVIVGRTAVGHVARGETPSRRQQETDRLEQLLALRRLPAAG
jgi:hypothetical protein